MHEPPESSVELDPTSLRCLERTRSWVLNILVVVGLMIMASGLILRYVDWKLIVGDVEGWRRALYGGLIGVIAFSHLTRRIMGARDRLRPPETRAERFFKSHVGAAAVGGLAAALGLVYGLTIEPRFESVVIFWVAALVLGILALPKSIELEDFSEPMTPAGITEAR
ncbi:hypothetical protein [Paludisphaera borealis]|uniref:Uncharacterized protein n=1 Tax=Paludisphaera borealis TaxID=1387353 RepID=A0A1U7CP24_9BACT|nr:hypothetical protein [Paludisphaera borealis]APW60633.1 hypothetical protein BSF38_02116 [Paludisphaera borealis]